MGSLSEFNGFGDRDIAGCSGGILGWVTTPCSGLYTRHYRGRDTNGWEVCLMATKWLIGMVTLWIICTVISLFLEAQQYGSSEVATLYTLLTPDIPSFWNPIGAAIAYITVAWDYISVFWSMFWWDYSFFTGGWELVRFILFIPLSAGIIVSLVFATIRGVSSG